MQVTYDPATGTGKVVYNLSLVKNEDFEYAVSILKDAYKTGVSVSGLVKFFRQASVLLITSCPKGARPSARSAASRSMVF